MAFVGGSADQRHQRSDPKSLQSELECLARGAMVPLLRSLPVLIRQSQGLVPELDQYSVVILNSGAQILLVSCPICYKMFR